MHAFNFRKNFQRLGFRSPDWQRAKTLFKLPIRQLQQAKFKVETRFQSLKNQLKQKPIK